MQRHIVVGYVSRYFAVKRVKATFNINDATWLFVHTILENAAKSGKAGAVAEYLVGAKLAIKFPNKEIRNKRFSVSDARWFCRGLRGRQNRVPRYSCAYARAV